MEKLLTEHDLIAFVTLLNETV